LPIFVVIFLKDEAILLPTENRFDALQRRPGLEFLLSDFLFSEKELQCVNITFYQGARNIFITTGTISGIGSELGAFWDLLAYGLVDSAARLNTRGKN
jgi:hypothetical protein